MVTQTSLFEEHAYRDVLADADEADALRAGHTVTVMQALLVWLGLAKA